MARRRRNHRDPNLESILRIAKELGFDDPAVQKLVAAAIGTSSTRVRKRIEKRLAAEAAKREINPFPESEAAIADHQERIKLGTTINGSTFELRQDNLTTHLLAVGKTGAGKTTLFYNIMDQLTVPFWAFDLKQDYRHLVQHDPDLLVLPWSRLKFNPLQPPPGIRPRRWAQVVSEILGHATALLSGSKNYLMKQIVKLYELYDVLETVEPPYPSLLELQLLLRHDRINYVRKQANYRDTVQNRLAAMNRTAGSIFKCSEGFPIEELLRIDVVFELDGLGEDTQNFLMEILMAYVYEYRLGNDQRGGRLRHVFFMDEGKRVFSVYKERQDAAGLPTIDELTARMREFGEGLVVADQEASKLTDSIKANTDTKILLSTGDAKQFDEMADSMFLSERQRELAKQAAIGEAIIQSGGRAPIPVNLDQYELEKKVSDSELGRRQLGAWEALTFEEVQFTDDFQDAVELDTEELGDSSGAEQHTIEISDEAERLLADVAERPFLPLTDRYEMFSSTGKGSPVKAELVSKGFVVERKIRVPELKRTLLELTQRGRMYLHEEMGNQAELEGRGGIVHQFWQHTIKDIFEDYGWLAELEKDDADVVATQANIELAIEVAMGDNPREVEHVQNHLEQFDNVVVACRDKSVMDGIRKRLEERGLLSDRVSLHTFQTFSDV